MPSSSCHEIPQHQQTPFENRLMEKEIGAGLTDTEILEITHRAEIYRRLEGLIGNTPKIEIALPHNNRLIQTDETANPTETHYDRVYLQLFRELEAAGKIQPGDILLETTSGSAGISFAWMAKKLGYTSIIFAPSFLPEPRKTAMDSLANKVHYSDDRKTYLKGCADMMVAYWKNRDNQKAAKAEGRSIRLLNHSQNPIASQAFTSIISELTNNQINLPDYFIGGIGNGATILGVAEPLKIQKPNAKVIGFEPIESCPFYKQHQDRWGQLTASLTGQMSIPDDFKFHNLPGIGSFGNIDFPFIKKAIRDELVDDIIPIQAGLILNSVSYNAGLAPENQQGHTSIIARYLAERMAERVNGKTFLGFIYDKNDRY
jgi:cysteine synthase